MKKIYLLIFCFVFALCSHAQIKRYAVGPGTLNDYNLQANTFGLGPNYYANTFAELKDVAAFLNANNTMPTGYNYLYFELQADYEELVKAPIAFSSTINVRIFPGFSNAGATTNSDPLLGSNPMIVLNGAKNLTFDGRKNLTGTNISSDIKWIIENKQAGGGETFSLINGSQNNILSFLEIRNSNVSSFSGAVVFGSSSGASNNSNAVTECRFTNSTANEYYNAILSTSSANASNTISNNWIGNFSRAGVTLEPSGAGDAWFIIGNHIFSSAAAGHMTAIDVRGGSFHKINSNQIGGTSASRGGSPLLSMSSVPGTPIFVGIRLFVGDNALNTEVGDNIIGNIVSDNGNASSAAFYGIWVQSGSANIYQNKIGPGGIFTYGDTYGITVLGVGSQVYKNEINNMQGGQSGSYEFCGLHLGTTGHCDVLLNVIDHTNYASGNTNVNPLNASTAIWVAGSGTADIYKNTLSFRNASITDKSPMTIFAVSGGSNVKIRSNTVYSTNNSGTANGKNTDSDAGTSYGLYQTGGIVDFNNNSISLGSSTVENIRGISLQTTASGSKYLYNTIYLGGTPGGSSYTDAFCFERGATVAGGAQTIANNIFFNNRVVSSGFGGSFKIDNSSGWGQMNVHHNLHVTPDDYPMNYGGIWKTFSQYQADLKELYGYHLENADIPAGQFFINQTPTSGDLRVNSSSSYSWHANGKGMPQPGYDKDFYNIGSTRSINPTIASTDLGAYEFTPANGVEPPAATLSGGTDHDNGKTELIQVGGRTIAEIKWGLTGTIPAITAKYYTGVKATPAPDPNGTPRTLNAYWDITATGGSNYTYDLKWFMDPAHLSNVQFPDPDNHIIKKSGNANWQDRATTYDGSEGSLKISGEAGFSLFTVANVNTVMPVSLLYFNAAKQNNDVVLQWKSAAETNHKSYTVERSLNGINFDGVQTLLPSGSKEYSVNDLRALDKYAGKLYYRLKMISLQGSKTYSAVAIIDNTNAKLPAIKMTSPNPFKDHIDLQFNNEKPNRTSVVLYDQSGKILSARNVILPAGGSSVRIDKLEKLSSATYILKVTTETGGLSMNVLKE